MRWVIYLLAVPMAAADGITEFWESLTEIVSAAGEL